LEKKRKKHAASSNSETEKQIPERALRAKIKRRQESTHRVKAAKINHVTNLPEK
jgi:hypothetical protein